MKRTLTLQQACSQYVHRFTGDHIPQWAKTPLERGKYYAPQFRTDVEWYAHTAFPGEPDHPFKGETGCYTTGQTWPFGLFLAEPYTRGVEPKPWTPPQPAPLQTRMAWVLLEEHQNEHGYQDTYVRGLVWSEDEAKQWCKDEEDEELAEGKAVHGREDDWDEKHEDEGAWELNYTYTTVEVAPPPVEIKAPWTNQPADCPSCQPCRNAALLRCRDCGKHFTPCPATLVPENSSVRCCLAEGHAGAHQDLLLPKRRWT